MSEQELKIILAAAFCLNKVDGQAELVSDLLAYAFKRRFDIDLNKLAMYCMANGKKVLPEVAKLLNTTTTYKRIISK